MVTVKASDWVLLNWPVDFKGWTTVNFNQLKNNKFQTNNKMGAVPKLKCKFYNKGFCKYKSKGCDFFHPEESCADPKCENKDCSKRHKQPFKFRDKSIVLQNKEKWNCSHHKLKYWTERKYNQSIWEKVENSWR